MKFQEIMKKWLHNSVYIQNIKYKSTDLNFSNMPRVV